jgi:hypothetical protein
MSDPDPDPVVPRLDTSGTRVPRRVEQPRTLGGAAATVALLLAGVLVAAASPMLLAGALSSLAIGAVAGFLVSRRADRRLQFCLPRQSVCVEV